MARLSRATLRAWAGRLRRSLARTDAVAAPVDASVVDLVAELLADAPRARVAVITEGPPTALAAAISKRCPDADLVRQNGRHAPAARHAALAVSGPFDLVVVTGVTGKARVPRFQETFHQLVPGGRLVLAGAATELPGQESVGALGELLARAEARRGQKPVVRRKGVPLATIDEQALARVITDLRAHGRHLVATNGASDTLVKLREGEANLVIERRPDLGARVLEVVKGQTFTSRCTLRESTEPDVVQEPTRFEALSASLREYRDVVVAPGQVVTSDRMLWPDTYRHNARRRLLNGYTEEIAPRFARVPFSVDEAPALAGTYFHLDNEVRGHFGHLMTETVSRLWAWPQAKELVPDLKVLVCTNRRPEVMAYELGVYVAAGIPAEDVVLVHEPVRVERLLSASPMLSNPEYVHPAIVDTWRRLGDSLAAGAEGGPRPARFFCSRRLSKRSCHNTAEVEDVFRAAGFEIVFPEDYSLGDQVEMFRAADVVAGFAGSGLFNLCFVEKPVRVVMIRSEAYSARNEYLFASVLGHTIDSISSVPDKRGDFQSPFTFDLEHEGRYLAQVLADLD